MNLVQVNSDNQIVVSSRDIAKHFAKAHGDVLKSVDNLVKENSLTKKMFFESSREYRGQSFRYFLMNRDGFSLLVMGFTGKQALDWKLKYIEAFNTMERELSNSSKIHKEIESNTAKIERLAIMKQNAKVREAALWAKLAEGSSGTYQQVCKAYAANTLAEKDVVSLPKAEEKTYTATEIGNMLNVSAHKIGRLANTHKLKTAEYGSWYHDKAKHSGKEVETFRYNAKAINKFRQILHCVEVETDSETADLVGDITLITE